MSDGSVRSFDPQGDARAVLQSAVADFGIKVLSNATILEGICEDRLPELPREASLIASASRADVVGLLEQQASGVGPDAAVRLTAGALADSRSLDPAACVWVVREFARVLGYPVPDDSGPGGQRPAGPPAGGAAPPVPTMPAPAAAGAASVPPAGAPVEAPTMMPAGSAAAAAAAPAPAAGQPPVFSQPPAAGPLNQPPPAPGGFGPPQPAGGFGAPAGALNEPPAAGGYRFSNPPVAGAATQPPAFPPGQAGWGGNGGVQQAPPPWPAPAPRSGKSRGPLFAGGGVLAVIVVYLIIASVGSLPPFGHKPTPAPSHPVASSSPAASSGSSPAANPAPAAHLRALIPATFLAKGNCTAKTPQAAGETAQIWCHNVPNVPAGFVDYYLFDNTSDLNAAYGTFLTKYAKTTRNSGNCHSFTTFTPCETPFGPGHTTAGRMVEYLYQGSPDITFTDTRDLLLIDTSGNDGTSLVTWWAKLPMPWVTSG